MIINMDEMNELLNKQPEIRTKYASQIEYFSTVSLRNQFEVVSESIQDEAYLLNHGIPINRELTHEEKIILSGRPNRLY